MESTSIVILTLIVYKLALLAIGFWASRNINSESDYFIAGQGAGRGLGALTAGLSYGASTSSAWVLLGYTGFVFTVGVKALWIVPGVFAGYVLTWLVLGPKLNAETETREHVTVVDFLVADIDDGWRKRISYLCALMIIFCFVFYIAAQFQAAGNAFVSIFNMSMLESVVLGAVIIMIYCFMGGFVAASLSDALQAVVMMAACVLVPFIIVQNAGGIGQIFELLKQQEPASYLSFSGDGAFLMTVGAAIGLLGIGQGAMGQPQLLNRIMAARDQKTRIQGAWITIIWGGIVYSGVTTLAFAARALMPDIPSEEIFFTASERFLPIVLAGIVTAAILSAVMSTVDSLLLAAASAVSHDLGLARFFPRRELLVGRIAMLVIGVVAVIMTLNLPDSIFDRVLFSWVALGAAFGPTILMRCLGYRMAGAYVFSAIVVGFLIAVFASYNSSVQSDIIEKWVSWIAGLSILYIGRVKVSQKV